MEKVDEPQSSSGTPDSHTLPGRARVCTDHAHKLFAHLAVAQEIVGNPRRRQYTKHSLSKSQSYVRFPIYSQWRERFLSTVLAESAGVLKRGGRLVLNVSNVDSYPIADDSFAIASPSCTSIPARRLDRQTTRFGLRERPAQRGWVKVKLTQAQEFVIGGYTLPEGGRKYFGALLVGYYGLTACSSPAESAPNFPTSSWRQRRPSHQSPIAV